MKIFNIIFCLIFILSAALQYNDPDPYIWVPIYLYGAWFCFQAFRGKYYPKAYLAGILIYTIYALYLWFDKSGVMSWYSEHNAENIVQSMKATKPWIEETREFGGLLLLIIALGINYFVYRKPSATRF
ncbi:transmembrane 220 family protein [Pedobacter sp.]|uniref:transmembrane 220 family protein n=1 Tax=Pedobacter sp. TaxID=1411316 RepID=UPI003BABF5D9